MASDTWLFGDQTSMLLCSFSLYRDAQSVNTKNKHVCHMAQQPLSNTSGIVSSSHNLVFSLLYASLLFFWGYFYIIYIYTQRL